MEICAIEKNMVAGSVISWHRGVLRKPMLPNEFELGFAMPRELAELSDRIAFGDPKLEPRKFVLLFNITSLPSKCFLADLALVSLRSFVRFSETACWKWTALRTSIFLIIWLLIWNLFHETRLSLTKIYHLQQFGLNGINTFLPLSPGWRLFLNCDTVSFGMAWLKAMKGN